MVEGNSAVVMQDRAHPVTCNMITPHINVSPTPTQHLAYLFCKGPFEFTMLGVITFGTYFVLEAKVHRWN
jgi:hypothetical protein